MEEFEKLLSVKNLARATGLSISFLKRAAAAGEIKSYKIGRLVRFRLSEVSSWVSSKQK